MKRVIRDHYHWIVAANVFLHLGVFIGFSNTAGLFVLPVTQSLGISRGSYSFAATLLYNLCLCLTQMVSGLVYKRFGYRKMICSGLILTAVSFLVIASSRNLAMLCLGSVLLGAASGVCTSASANRLINEWFHRHRGLVWGVLTASTGLGGSIWCLFLPTVIQEASWRGAYILAASLMCVILITDMVFIRNKPADMGLLPYGEEEHIKKINISERYFLGCSFSELIRKSVFYLTLVTLFVIFLCIYLPYSVVVAHLCDKGLAATEAAQLQGVLLLALALGKVAFGWLIDRIGVRKVTVICCLCAAVAMLLLPMVSDYSQALGVMVIYGLALTSTTIIAPALTVDLFGYNSYITTVGIFSSTVSAGNMIAGPISNGVFDKLGSYTTVFWTGAIIMLLVVVVFGVICRLADKMKKQSKEFAA